MTTLRTTALTLALTMSLALLPACGGKQPPQSSAPGASVSAPDASQAPVSSSQDACLPDASTPDVSLPDVSAPSSSSQPEPTPEPAPTATLSLNKSDFTLFKAGDSYRLRYTMEPDCDGIPKFSSSAPDIAAVSEDGTVTAVSPGTAVITLEYGGLNASCTVRCKFQTDVPASGSGSSSASGWDSSSGSSAPASSVDLSAFYTSLTGKYEFPSFMALADGEIVDNLFPGLNAVDTQQCLVYANMMSMNMGELVLVQVTDSKDVDTVKGVLQARVDTMIDGGAWYPEPTELWTNSSQVVSNGNYILMVVNESCDAIVSDFNALF